MKRWWRRLGGAALVVAATGFAVPVFTVATSAPASAQFFGESQYPRRQYQDRGDGGGFFGGFFGDWGGRQRREPVRRYHPHAEPPHHADYSRAPPPHKPDTQPDPNKPVTSIVVMGGSMADWLAYGLEDAFSDSPNVEIVRKDEPHSGLIRYKYKSDLDWWHVAREDLAKTKANYVVMMLGALDRQNIRESDVEQDNQAADQAKSGDAQTADQTSDKTKPKPKAAKNGVVPFRSDQWARIYTRRIDETIAALKSKGVPVFWVGLPSIRGTKSTADAVYLNNLFRSRAERAGIVYIDVWDGFVDDSGKYSSYGPDYEGQTRRLRSPDGVFFTKYGARKLAHYVEREIRRYMTNRVTTLTLPSGQPGAGAAKSGVRPLAGPVLPLTAPVGNSDVLLGGQGMRPARADAVASRVLVKGNSLKAPPGRADDFNWPPDSQDYGKPPPPPKPAKVDAKSIAPMTPANASPGVASNPPTALAPSAAQQAAAPAASQAADDAKANAAAAAADAKAKAQAEAKAEDAAKAKAAADAKARAEQEARAKAEADARKRAEARRRAAERARAQAQRRREWYRPPARVENRRQPPRQSDDPFSNFFGLAPR